MIQILIELNRRQVAKRADAERNARHQETARYQADKFAPTREVFEEFLEAGQKTNIGISWLVTSGSKLARSKWERQETIEAANGQKIVVRAFTDPKKPKFGYKAGNVKQALIGVKVSLSENPDVNQELELPPVWAILEQDSDISFQDLDKLEDDLADIVPLIRARLPQS